jgi:tRNA A-37 threonylcarbamoyl transferase component Bud32
MTNADSSSRPAQDSEATRVVTGRVASSTLAPGTLLGNTYIIEELLARGGMGEVYRARHVELGTEHAIKIILPRLAEDPKIAQLFREEARKLARLNSDAVVDYEGFFRDERGLRYLVTEFVPGESLEQVLRRRRLEPDEVLRLRDRLALGLAGAHEMGIVHRDVSPENILLPGGNIDHAKIIDFGIAKSSDPSSLTIIGSDFAGKYSYVSPEQVGLFGGRVDLRSDIYSLGLVLAAAAIGFGRKLDMGNSAPTMISARQRPPDLSEVPAALRPVIAPMLEPRPDDRPPSMRALLSGPRSEPVPLPKRRLALWAASAAAVLVASVAAALIVVRVTIPPPSLEGVRTQIAAATSEYRCAALDYSVSPDHSVHLSGFAQTQGDIERLRSAVDRIGGIRKLVFDVGLRIWPYCEAAALLQPVVKRTPAPAPSLALVQPGPGAHIGDALVIDVRAPSFDGYIYIDYFADGEGDVVHLLPNKIDPEILKRPARNPFTLGRSPFKSCLVLAGAAGEQQLVTFTASTQRLFRDERPIQENAQEYLPILSDAIKSLPEDSSRGAALLFFQLLDPLPFAARQNSCVAAAQPAK